MTMNVAQITLPFYQILNTEGQLAHPLPASLNHPDKLIGLYRIMVIIRAFDKKAIALQRTGKMGTYAPISGQEAISTAIGQAMRPEDVFVPYYRDYAAQYQRGVKLSEILSYWGGDERGSQYHCGSQDLPISVPIASQCLHAAGLAFAFKYRGQDRVAVVCLGDGGTSEGDFYEAINVAGAWNLPLVIVVNNNQWAISVPLAKQTAAQTIAQKAIAAGFMGVQADGNDVLAMQQCLDEAIDKARKGQGPTLIEALTYRLCDHTTADDASRYQPIEEVDQAKLKEPVARLRKFLEDQGHWDLEKETALQNEASALIQAEVDAYLQRPAQPIQSIFDYHFEKSPDYLIEQRAIAMEEQDNA